jgi:nicotinamide-nucleotide amidase
VIAELINTGSELLLGRVLNTHQQWLCRQLADLGYVVRRQVAVPDTGPDIQQAVRESLGRADLIICTGGLGPTSDDLTRELIAGLLNRPLREDAAILAAIEKFFAARNRTMSPNNRVQALVPEGAVVLHNPNGTAPGLAICVTPNPFREANRTSWLIMLPGPPRELRPMFQDQVVPLLRRELPVTENFVCRTLRTTGIGESLLAQRVAAPLQTLVAEGLEVGYCAHTGQVDVRLAARGAQAEQLVAGAEKTVRARLADCLFAEGEESLEAVIVRLLATRKLTLALAESCTGGAIANRITNVPGASAVFAAGLVTYSNASKQQWLGVQPETISAHGAVSEAVAREMASGARNSTAADFALSVTGIAGPDGGSPEKPVGTVFIGLATQAGVTVEKFFNPYDRETFKIATGNQALDKLRRALLAR